MYAVSLAVSSLHQLDAAGCSLHGVGVGEPLAQSTSRMNPALTRLLRVCSALAARVLSWRLRTTPAPSLRARLCTHECKHLQLHVAATRSTEHTSAIRPVGPRRCAAHDKVPCKASDEGSRRLLPAGTAPRDGRQ